MMFRRMAWVATVAAGMALGGCGGGGGSNYPIQVSFSTAPPSSIAINATASVAALVANDSGTGGVTWSATCAGGSGCGTFNPTSTGSAVATTYTAPATIPNPATVTITATSVSDTTKSVSANVTIVSSVTPPLADGTYVYHLSGYDGAGGYTIAGAFTIAAGVITGGEQDFTDPQAGYTDTLVTKTSSVNTAGGNLQIVIDTGNTQIGVNGVETLRGTQVSATRVLLSEYDLSATGTGALDLQTSHAEPANGYAFAISGNDTAGNPLSIGGIFVINGTQLNTSASLFDLSDFTSGAPQTLRRQTFQSGSVTATDSFGRFVLTLVPSTGSTVPQIQLAGYVTSTGRLELVESGQSGDTLNGNTGGSALGQGSNTGKFTNASASVVNQSYAHGSSGVDLNGVASMSGAFALNLNGILTGVLAVNDVQYMGAWTIAGSYAVDPTGRVEATINTLTGGNAPPSNGVLTFELYLDGNGNAMVMGLDAFQTTQGIAFEQDSNFSLSGNYALAGQGAAATSSGGVYWSAVGPVTVTAGTFSGTTDSNPFGGTLKSAVALGGSQNSGQGLLNLTGLNPTSFTTSTAFGYYPLSGNRLWAIEVDNQGLGLLLLEGVTP
ncbi:MAG: hypothetical protein JSS29_02830 [Proteobacteria bacterium]|nr:hypothetical protein [Pseudomonadota bacterium]